MPVSQKIASGQIVVRANGYVQYRFQITPDMRNAHVSGRFNRKIRDKLDAICSELTVQGKLLDYK